MTETSPGFTRRLAGGLALAAGLLLSPSRPSAAAPTEQLQSIDLAPTRVATAAQSRCGPSLLATPGTECQGFDAREVRAQPDLWVVGYENNQELGEKHVLQTVATFELVPLRSVPAGATLARAALVYGEVSTTRRSPSGESEYGILPTCNTQLGLPTEGWGGGLDQVVPTRPAAVAGVAGATTGDDGAWDVTPQLQQWLAGGATQGSFVLRGDDESMDIKGQQMCLSYVIDLGLAVEFAVPQ